MSFLKLMPWRSGFQGAFPAFRVPHPRKDDVPEIHYPLLLQPAVWSGAGDPLPGSGAAWHHHPSGELGGDTEEPP